jgi:glycine dehydrogenase subunit 1
LANFTPHTKENITEMLTVTGALSVEELFKDIPDELRVKSFEIPPGKTEYEVLKIFRNFSEKNKNYYVSFLGGGYYDHFIPSAVDSISCKPEFFTAYTPYQPEASQGTLEAIFEYQTMIAKISGMEAANASLYDGGTALYEAVVMAVRQTKKSKVIIDTGVNPLFRKILKTHIKNLEIDLIEVELNDIYPDKEKIKELIDNSTAAVIIQSPNFFGVIEDYSDIFKVAKEKGTAGIMSYYPLSLGILKTPGEMGADIAVAEGQSLGLPLSFGGPYLGLMSVNKNYVRKIPGRIVGETEDTEGKRAYVLTLQAREQHIRREKATSNICSNQALCALRASTYLSLLGKDGYKKVALLNLERAEYLKKRLKEVNKIRVKEGTTFNEFTVEIEGGAKSFVDKMISKGYIAGLPVSFFYNKNEDYLIVSVTEKRTEDEINSFIKIVKEVLK